MLSIFSLFNGFRGITEEACEGQAEVARVPVAGGVGSLSDLLAALKQRMGVAHALWLLGAGLIACAMGALSGVMFGLMMYFARAGSRALDDGLQASLFTLSRLAVPVLAGIVLDRLGYPAMFTALALCMVVVVGGALLGSKVLQESISKRGEVR